MSTACTGMTKAGKPCKSPPLKGTGRCLSHSPAKTRDSVGFKADNGKGGRPRKPRLAELLRERMEGMADEIFKPLIEGLTATRWVVVGAGPTAHVEEVPDIPTRISATREILDRLDGRPKQATELSGPDGGAIPLGGEVPSDADFHTNVAKILQEAGATGSPSQN